MRCRPSPAMYYQYASMKYTHGTMLDHDELLEDTTPMFAGFEEAILPARSNLMQRNSIVYCTLCVLNNAASPVTWAQCITNERHESGLVCFWSQALLAAHHICSTCQCTQVVQINGRVECRRNGRQPNSAAATRLVYVHDHHVNRYGRASHFRSQIGRRQRPRQRA